MCYLCVKQDSKIDRCVRTIAKQMSAYSKR